ncbi:MAG: hypothetical protein GEU99_10785 [Luteitalea sp.]|nr:hypothetical protein [Luteitalea sp.]
MYRSGCLDAAEAILQELTLLEKEEGHEHSAVGSSRPIGRTFRNGGSTKVFIFEKVSQQVASNNALPREMWMCIGIFELLCAVGLVIPAATGKSPVRA